MVRPLIDIMEIMMKDIKFVKDGAVKVTQERFTKELQALGWAVADDAKPDNQGKANQGKESTK